jgi:hypothetical protein
MAGDRDNMQFLKQDDIDKIKSELALITSRYSNLTIKLWKLFSKLKTEKAKEYLIHGVMRRLGIMMRSIENVFSIFPIERDMLLSMNELSDVDINLHAFLINIFGLLDNLAWVVIHEQQLTDKIDKKNVGLYENKTQVCFTEKFRSYLNSDRMKKWRNEYLKNYRDALSHRIPPYVPPKTLNPEQKTQEEQIENKIVECYKSLDLGAIDKLRKEQESIGDVCPYLCHALSENKAVVLHAQLIADFKTIEEIIEKYCEMFLV